MYDGTWAGDTIPPEVRDYELMREMGWSWADLEAAPAYVARYCWDLMNIRRRAEAEAKAAKERAQAGR